MVFGDDFKNLGDNVDWIEGMKGGGCMRRYGRSNSKICCGVEGVF